MTKFELNKNYTEVGSGNDYQVFCTKLTKCFATFKSYSGEKTYKINRKNTPLNEACYTSYGVISAR